MRRVKGQLSGGQTSCGRTGLSSAMKMLQYLQKYLSLDTQYSDILRAGSGWKRSRCAEGEQQRDAVGTVEGYDD